MHSFTVSHTTPSGNTFTYAITGITRWCWVITAEHTGETRQYNSKGELRGFCRRLADHLDAKFPAAEAAGEFALAMVA
jgi:hypothetical protein